MWYVRSILRVIFPILLTTKQENHFADEMNKGLIYLLNLGLIRSNFPQSNEGVM